MKLKGVPISDDQCIGDSLPIINEALLAINANANLVNTQLISLSSLVKTTIDSERTVFRPSTNDGFFWANTNFKVAWGTYRFDNSSVSTILLPISFSDTNYVVIPTTMETNSVLVTEKFRDKIFIRTIDKVATTDRGDYIAVGK